MKRILVIGSGGAGKSTVATRLGQSLNLKVHHLDKYYWRAGWVKPSPEEWLQTVTELINRESWIIDGNYGGTLPLRLQRCDTIVFLDMPRLLSLWRIVKRNFRYRNGGRPDIAEGCPEKLDFEFVSWVWNYSRRTRPGIVELIRTHGEGKRVVWLRSKCDVEKFLTDPSGASSQTAATAH